MARIVRSPPEAPAFPPRTARAARWRDPALAAPALAALTLWLAVAVPVGLGHRSFFFRDVFGNHLPLKAFGAEALARGEVPAFNPQLGMGQPFRGNPSALAFYPGNLLYLVLPFWSAFNLHYALHWLLAALAMVVLARELRQSEAAALFAGITYGGSGFVLSCLTFYNVLTVAAWWPLAIAGAARGGRRGVALGGLACGMALLGGEPLAAALGLVPLLLAAVERHGSLRGLATAAAVGALGALVALPQLVATARIVGFSFRGDHGVLLTQVLLFVLQPQRLLELVIPFPFGWPMDLGPHGWWAWKMGQIPYFLSLYAGIVALWLAVGAARRRPIWAALAAAGLLFGWLWGAAGEALASLTGGVFRYPERFVVWYGLVLPLLAGWGLDQALRRPARRARAAWWAGGVLGLAALAAAAARPALLGFARRSGGPPSVQEVVSTQTLHWIGYLAAGAILLALAALAAHRRRAGLLLALQLVALTQLWPLVRTAPTAPFRRAPDWLARVPERAAVFYSLRPRPAWEPMPERDVPEDGGWADVALQHAADLEPVPGAFHGLTYPLWPDIEGLSTPLYSFLTVRLAMLDWPERIVWLRAIGVDAAVFHRQVDAPGVRLVAQEERLGVPTFLYRVDDPAPDAWWPERLRPAPGPIAALVAVPDLADPVREVVVARPVAHRPGGRAAIVEEAPDRVVLEVESEGGLAVLRRSYHTLYRARAGDRGLSIQPVQLTLLGIEVPPGRHRVAVSVDDRPETAALVLSALAALAALGLAWRAPAARPSATGAASGPAGRAQASAPATQADRA